MVPLSQDSWRLKVCLLEVSHVSIANHHLKCNTIITIIMLPSIIYTISIIVMIINIINIYYKK